MGTVDTLGVSLVVAMSMQCIFVAQFLSSAFASWDDVIDLNDISILKKQFTPSTLSRLLLEQFAQHSTEQRVSSEPLTPVQQVAIIGTSTTVGVRFLQQPVAVCNDTLEQRPDGDAERKTRQGSGRV